MGELTAFLLVLVATLTLSSEVSNNGEKSVSTVGVGEPPFICGPVATATIRPTTDEV